MISCHATNNMADYGPYGQVSDSENPDFIHFRTMPAGRRTRLQTGGHVLLLPDVWLPYVNMPNFVEIAVTAAEIW